MAADIHVGDIGTTFQATVKDQDGVVVDISTATTKEFYFLKPDRSTVTKAGTFVTSGVDGKLKYVSVLGFLDQQGNWEVQGHVVLPGGAWKTDTHAFAVLPNLA